MISDIGHGQVWWADLDKVRPVVVVTRRSVAPHLRRVLVAPVTTVARGLATEVPLGIAEGIGEESVASLDNVQQVPVERLLKPAGSVDSDRWPEFCRALAKVAACRF